MRELILTKKYYLIILWVCLIALMSVTAEAQINPKASLETKKLYQKLFNLSGKGFLFGQQNANRQGVGMFIQRALFV